MGALLGQIPRWTSGLLAMGTSLYFIWQGDGDNPIFFASVFLFIIVITDTLYSKIHNIFTLALLLVSLGYHVTTAGLNGLFFSLLGLIVGLALLMLPYILGGTGAGDVKALGALGALEGAQDIFHIFIYMAVIGGVLSLVQYLFHPELRRRAVFFLKSCKTAFLTRSVKALAWPAGNTSVRFPYATAIAFGFYAFVHWGRLA